MGGPQQPVCLNMFLVGASADYVVAVFESVEKLLDQVMMDRVFTQVFFQVSFRDVGGVRPVMDEDMVPGFVARWP